jgi:tetratricopeptide (TPR) repeat protein
MNLKDHRDHEISGATPEAREAFEQALASFQSWRVGTEAHLARATLAAPAFTMAHVLGAYLLLCTRDVRRVREARRAYAQASALPANARERMHLAAIRAALADDLEACWKALDALLEQYPHDVIALQVGHALDYVTGDSERMDTRIAAVMPSWSPGVPGYSAVLAMQAFAAVECAQYEVATEVGLEALELDPRNARAHHALTHVYEMTQDATGGMRFMRERLPLWTGTTVATHCWWHWALFHIAEGEYAFALALYDERVRAGHSAEIADMIDASALLWRLDLAGVDTGTRWLELAGEWARRADDGFCTFSDLHAMLALVGARDWAQAQRLESELLRRRPFATRHGETTRLIGLPACRGLIAFGRGRYARAIELLSALPAFAGRIGGSHAQRDVLYLTLLEAVQRMRRPRVRAGALACA